MGTAVGRARSAHARVRCGAHRHGDCRQAIESDCPCDRRSSSRNRRQQLKPPRSLNERQRQHRARSAIDRDRAPLETGDNDSALARSPRPRSNDCTPTVDLQATLFWIRSDPETTAPPSPACDVVPDRLSSSGRLSMIAKIQVDARDQWISLSKPHCRSRSRSGPSRPSRPRARATPIWARRSVVPDPPTRVFGAGLIVMAIVGRRSSTTARAIEDPALEIAGNN
jgi:hypothetical protein